ncbi:MAG TPA: metallophosphoesterase [Verrucomicrobiae bacterium]
MKISKTSRRRFLLGAILAAPLLAVGDAKWLEPTWIKTRRVRLRDGKVGHRLVHFTDVHHKGDRQYLLSVVRKINALSPDSVCFTGDLIEEKSHLHEALEILKEIKSPLFGVPGNHDYWSKVVFKDIAEQFAKTGGRWLMDEQQVTRDGKLSIIGATCVSLKQPLFKLNPATRTVVLMHYPAWVKKFESQQFDLLLAGHSHGGQVRLPLYGPIYIPFGVEQYDMGLFQTPCGPLYVNPGIGWFPYPIRFNCRPEITVFDL